MAFRALRILWILLFIGYSALAGSIHGKITDTSGAPVSGAIVTIPDLKAGATTDINGNYSIKNLPSGLYLMQVKMLSYKTISAQVAIMGATQKDFVLTNSIIEGSEVVITGTSSATEKRRSPAPIISIGLKELKEHPSSNLIDAIATVPGVSEVTTGPAISKPIIRGLGGNRVLVISDHVRQEGQQWGDEHGVEVDDYNVSRIEILKGPASLAYGSDALAGVIHIVTDEPSETPRPSGTVHLNYQSNNGLAAANASLGNKKNGFHWATFATYKTAHDYQNVYDGYVFNSRFHNFNFGAKVGLHRRWGYSGLTFTSFNQELGIVEGERDSATGEFLHLVNEGGVVKETIVPQTERNNHVVATPSQKINHQKLVWNSGLFLAGDKRLNLTLGYQQNTRREFTDVLHPDEPGLFLLLKTVTYDLRYHANLFREWKASVGLNGMYQNNSNHGTEFLIPDYRLWDAGVYSIVQRQIAQWNFSGGIRYDFRNIKAHALYLDSDDEPTPELQPGGTTQFAAFSKDFSHVSGSLGVSYLWHPRTVLKLNFASGFRAPNIAELSSNGVHEGTVRYEYGNLNLKPESSYQADIGLNYTGEHILLQVSAFGSYVHSFIYFTKLAGINGNDSIPAASNPGKVAAFQYTQANALLYGGELFMDLHPHPLDWLHMEQTFSYVRARQAGSATDSTRNLPDIPPARWLISLRAQAQQLTPWLRQGYLKVGAHINFEQPFVLSAYNTETTSPGYTLFNVGLGGDLVNRQKRVLCSINFSISNLLNTAYQNHLSRLRFADYNFATGRRGVWNEGRNFTLLVTVPFQF